MIENERLEYKKSLGELKEALISIAAMLNKHGGGELWFGIRNDGTPVGFDVTDKTLRDLSQAIAAHIEPKIFPTISAELAGGKHCVKIAFTGEDAPYYAYGRAYIRVADADRQLSAKEVENRILDKNQEYVRWDNTLSDATLADLDAAKVRKYVETAGLPWDSLPNALEKLGVLRDGKLLNPAPLFFGREPGFQLRCAVFATASSSTIVDQHDYTGTILELIEEAQKYILKNIHIGMRLEGLYRVDVPEISTSAMREAIINAFCHRDYRDHEEVRVAIFKDRVEIRNPGSLFGGLTVEDLRKGGISKRRNPLIADLLRRIHMVEGWGRGMPLILEQEPEVRFREVAQIFITDFIRHASEEETTTINDETTTITTTITNTIPLSDTERAIIELFREEPALTLHEAARRLNMTKDGVRYHTKRLTAKGFLQRVGTKNGIWKITNI